MDGKPHMEFYQQLLICGERFRVPVTDIVILESQAGTVLTRLLETLMPLLLGPGGERGRYLVAGNIWRSTMGVSTTAFDFSSYRILLSLTGVVVWFFVDSATQMTGRSLSVADSLWR